MLPAKRFRKQNFFKLWENCSKILQKNLFYVKILVNFTRNFRTFLPKLYVIRYSYILRIFREIYQKYKIFSNLRMSILRKIGVFTNHW